MAQPVKTTTILNAEPFWMPLKMDMSVHSDDFKSVADLCFTGPFAVLGKAKYQYRPLRASRKTVQVWEHWRTYLMEKHVLLLYDLDLWPTTLT